MDIKKKGPFCSRILTINQVGPTCWFLATFMSMFYSQRSRKVLLDISKTWDTRIEIFNILKYILINKYLKTSDIKNDYSYFDIIKAETILTILNKHDKEKFEFDPTKKDGYFTESYISKLYEFLNVDSLMFDIYENTAAYSMFNHYYAADDTFKKIMMKHKSRAYINAKLAKLKTPHVLIVIVDDDKSKNDFKKIYYINKPHYIIKDENNSKNLTSLDDKIFYNNQEYNLDSVILSNWNTSDYNLKNVGHAICGITCKNERYVYNGWTRYTLDPNIKKNNDDLKDNDYLKLPCELMKLNWSLKDTHDFCLNTKKCIPDNTNISTKQNLCFSFNKGKRILIYIKKNNSSATSFDEDDNSKTLKSRSSLKMPKEILKKKICPPGKILNPLTKRCIKINGNISKKYDLIKDKICPPGKILNKKTNRCNKIVISSKLRDKKVREKNDPTKPVGPKICPPGKILNKKTNRCNKIKKGEKIPMIPENLRPSEKNTKKFKTVNILPLPNNISPIKITKLLKKAKKISESPKVSDQSPMKKLSPILKNKLSSLDHIKLDPYIPIHRPRPL